MVSPKSSVARRTLGNRLVTTVAMNLSEESHKQEPMAFSLVMDLCGDPNYEFRRDAAIFFKEYLKKNCEVLVNTDRLEETYLPEIYELLNDEESYVRIEVIEAILEILEHLNVKTIEQQFIPNFLKAIKIQKNQPDEIVARMASMIGKIVYKLSTFDLHLKYKEQILAFYKAMVDHRDPHNNKMGIYNLPCFNLLYKDAVSKTPPFSANSQSTSATQNIDPFDDFRDGEQSKGTQLDFHELYY